MHIFTRGVYQRKKKKMQKCCREILGLMSLG